ncbi:MAG TPA: asparagine synthase (glutamine-hydrolyzing) [Usitatibacter sp.]|nr:asparagine synthase (glutamine-hydrolyzing) [Usitatibacter sp.]
MCGIAGAMVRDASPVDAETTRRMLQALAHRGPDGHGVCEMRAGDGHRVLLGHRRLAIIDPRGGHQPMCDEAAGLALTYNGEIYNFRELRAELEGAGFSFRTTSDTEVLLRAWQHWGEGVVERLRGMFAFAIWDARRSVLFLARDRFGEKPLFLLEDGDELFFASEIKGLLQLPRPKPEVNLTAVWDYLAYRYVPGPRTLLRGIRKLAPGSCATWRAGKLTERRYWSPPDRMHWAPARAAVANGAGVANGHAVAEFTERLDQAVKMQMVSDVPFGAFLSGGLDSSAIVALMTRHNSKVKTFSVGFSIGEYSELSHAKLVAEHFGTEHTELVVDSEHLIEHLPKLVSFRDAPVTEPSDIPIYMLATEASRTVKMVLTGEGSDELLGGYPKHVYERFVPSYQRVPSFLRRGLIGPLAQALPYGFRRAKTAAINFNIEDWPERYARWFGALSNAERERLTRLRVTNGAAIQGPPFDSEPGNSTLRRILYCDQTSWLPDNLLERGDRMTMAASIESRVPFLDHELAGFVSSLPDHCRVNGMKTKWILRQAGRNLIPTSILERPKVGFRVPVNEWFRGPMKDYLRGHLLSEESRTRDYYDPKALSATVEEHIAGRHNHEKLLWSLLNLEIWHRQYA